MKWKKSNKLKHLKVHMLTTKNFTKTATSIPKNAKNDRNVATETALKRAYKNIGTAMQGKHWLGRCYT